MAKQTRTARAGAEEKLRISEDDLTVGDLEDFEDIVGRPIGEVLPRTRAEAKGWVPSAKVLKALVFIAKRRDDPGFTIEDARRVRVTELELAASSADRPTAAAG
jgi:hypothetical protein